MPTLAAIKTQSQRRLPTTAWFEIEDLPRLGWIQIEEMGSENLYFKYKDADGAVLTGYVKLR